MIDLEVTHQPWEVSCLSEDFDAADNRPLFRMIVVNEPADVEIHIATAQNLFRRQNSRAPGPDKQDPSFRLIRVGCSLSLSGLKELVSSPAHDAQTKHGAKREHRVHHADRQGYSPANNGTGKTEAYQDEDEEHGEGGDKEGPDFANADIAPNE